VSKPLKQFIDTEANEVKTVVIPNGVDTVKFDPYRFDKQAIKRRLGLEEKKVLGYVGSYKPWHGIDMSLAIIELLSRLDERYHLVLIGEGPCYQQITDKIKEKVIGKYVTQFRYVPHPQIPEYIACFDYALMSYPDLRPFYFSPLKMFEYMAMSLVVAATDIGQIGEIIENGHTGLLIYPPTPDNFVEVIGKKIRK
jgi:Glycosyltransferase